MAIVLAVAAALPTTSCHTALTAYAPTLPRGVLSLVDHFGADPTGAKDATAELQAAVTAAMRRNVTIFVPLGCYTITDTINATQPRNGRWQPIVIVGQQPPTGSNRPAFMLPANTAGFNDAKKSRPLLLFVTNWCLEPGLEEDVPAAGCSSTELKPDWKNSAYQFNQALVGIDIVLGAGNVGAIGIDMNAAQGSTLEDVGVFNKEGDALAGVAGGNGGGGSFKGVSVVGAKYGIDMRKTGSAPTLVAITLINQTCAGLLQGSASTLIATGLRISGSPILAGVIAGIMPNEFKNPQCNTPSAPYLADPADPENFFSTGDDSSGETGPASAALHSPARCVSPSGLLLIFVFLLPFSVSFRLTLYRPSPPPPASIVDSSVTIVGAVPCILANSSLYLSEVYTNGCTTVVASGGRPPLIAPTASATTGTTHTHVSLLGYGRVVTAPTTPYTYAFPTYIDGKRATNEGVAKYSASKPPPVDLQSKHLWGSDGGATWQSPGAVDALTLGAKGDGTTDDWPALQTAVDAHDIVFLPKGFFRLSKPLVLTRNGSALVGVGRTISFLMPMSTMSSMGTTADSPILDVRGKGVTVAFVTIATWDHLPFYALQWSR
jgi:hypothetical protein